MTTTATHTIDPEVRKRALELLQAVSDLAQKGCELAYEATELQGVDEQELNMYDCATWFDGFERMRVLFVEIVDMEDWMFEPIQGYCHELCRHLNEAGNVSTPGASA